MRAFARLLERLLFTPSRNAKLRLLEEYFAATPDPDRGWALAALSDGIDLPALGAARIRGLVEERVDPVLFALSYDYVGDLAETVALIWPAPEGSALAETPRLFTVIDRLKATSRSDIGGVFAGLLDSMGPSERLALIKLVTGGMRVGVSARLARTALAGWGTRAAGAPRPIERIEELWFGIEPPYGELFAWLEGGPEPDVDLALAFRPMMLANPVEDRWADLDAKAYRAEWKWDGIRVQAVAFDGQRRLYTRTGEDIGQAFPDVIASMEWQGCVDGELLVVRDGRVAPFADLQRRLGRKQVGARLMAEAPAHLRLYDILHDGEADTRALSYDERRGVLERWLRTHDPMRTDLSEAIGFDDWAVLSALRDGARDASQEGLMLKRGDSAYLAGRPVGPWYKWKRDPLTADCVLVYAQRGHGKRSSFYSDFTFAAWTGDGAGGGKGANDLRLVPVGKAYSGYTDEELKVIDRWIRNNTVERFGPVRSVTPDLVLEVAFDAVQRSTRHKSGIAMRFPRIKRIRWDKPAAEADRLETLEAMIPALAEETAD
ncbi:MAG: cisplatin damage response ATP-dependent DNA ligase [Pseudomonadota bacterium]